MLSEIAPALRRLGVVLPLLAAMATIAACGGSDSDEGSSTAASTTPDDTTPATTTSGETTQATNAAPLEAPKPKESIHDAEKRFAKAISSGDCDEINEIAYSAGQPTSAVLHARCEQYKTRFGNAKAADAEDLGTQGGVIDYTTPASNFSTPLVLGQDGLYHVVFIDPFLGGKSVGTKPAKRWDEATENTVKALRERDCDALMAASSNRFGPGAQSQSAACTFAENNPIATIFETDPKAKLQTLGSNGEYAFYAVAGPTAYYVLLMTRQSDEKKPPAAEPLPKDAPEYAFARVLRTNAKGSAVQ